MLAVGLVTGFGGSGNRHGLQHRAGGDRGALRAHSFKHVASLVRDAAPADVSALGLPGAGKGWVANGVGLFDTADSGRNWQGVHLTGLDDDVTGEITATASIPAHGTALAFAAANPQGGCARGSIALAHSAATAGRARLEWKVDRLPPCLVATSLSFLTASRGFAVLTRGFAPAPSWLYATRTGGASWRRVSKLPFHGSVDFKDDTAGWGVAAEDPTSGRGSLLQTTDGGRTWRPAPICRASARDGVKVACQTPVSFGRRASVALAVAASSRAHSARLLMYRTSDGGARWSATEVPGTDADALAAQEQPVEASVPAPATAVVFAPPQILSTRDGGKVWQRRTFPEFRAAGLLDITTDSFGWLVSGQHFDQTTDGGRHWQPLG